MLASASGNTSTTIGYVHAVSQMPANSLRLIGWLFERTIKRTGVSIRIEKRKPNGKKRQSSVGDIFLECADNGGALDSSHALVRTIKSSSAETAPRPVRVQSPPQNKRRAWLRS